MATATKTKLFTIVNAREFPNGAFYAEIKHGTKKVGTVEKHKFGSADLFSFDNREVEALFTEQAKTEFPHDVEPESELATRLAEESCLNKLRGGAIAYVLNLDDFYVGGKYKVLKPSQGVNQDEFITAVKREVPGILVWSKTEQKFVPVENL